MARYEKIIIDDLTGERALVKSNDPFVFEQKVEKQITKWQRSAEKQHAAQVKASKQDAAASRTAELNNLLAEYTRILQATLKKNDRIDWNEMKDRTEFHAFNPHPKPSRSEYFLDIPKKSFVELFLPFIRKKRERLEREAESAFQNAIQKVDDYNRKNWISFNESKQAFLQKQNEYNAKIDETKNLFEQGLPAAIEYYLNLVLERSEYPDGISLEHEVVFNHDRKNVSIKTLLPLFDAMKFDNEVKYVASKDSFVTKSLNKGESRSFYALIVYQIAIRTLHEIFEAEYTGHVQTIEFVGYIQGINTQKGTDVRVPIISLNANRDEFSQFNLNLVSAESCAQGLGGKLDKIAFELADPERLKGRNGVGL